MKIIKYLTIILAGVALMSLYSCEEDQDRLIYDGKALAFFVDETSGEFYVQDIAEATYEINVGLTKPASKDLTLDIEVIDTLTTAVAGTHYNMGTLTVKKGDATATLVITGLYDGFGADAVTLGFRIDGNVVNEEANLYNLTLQRYCPFDINDFVGTWEVTDNSYYNGLQTPYNVTTTIHNGDTLLVNNIWDDGEDIYMVFDDSDPANFTVEIFDQYYATHGTYGEMRISELEPGTFSACNLTISTSYQVYVAAGYFDVVLSSDWTFVPAP